MKKYPKIAIFKNLKPLAATEDTIIFFLHFELILSYLAQTYFALLEMKKTFVVILKIYMKRYPKIAIFVNFCKIQTPSGN